MKKSLLCLSFLFFTLASNTVEGVHKETIILEEKSLNCSLHAKAVQAGSFWGGTYFDTSVTSEKIKDLEVKVGLSDFKKGRKHRAAAKIKLIDKTIVLTKDSDPEGIVLSVELNFEKQSRSVSSSRDIEEVLPITASIRYGKQKYEKNFTVFSGNKAYVHINLEDPSHFKFKVTNIFMICSITR